MARAPEPDVDLRAVGYAFGLGPLEVLSYHHGSSGVWRVRDTHVPGGDAGAGGGTYALKLTPASSGSSVLERLASSGAFERDAAAAGVSMPRPLTPRAATTVAADGGRLGLAALVGGQYARLHTWVHAARPVTVGDLDDPRLGEWLATTLATLHAVGERRRDDAYLTTAYGLYPMGTWAGWFDQAARAGLPWAEAGPRAMALVDTVRPLTRTAVVELGPSCRVVHGDISPANVLLTPGGPMLCDVDAHPDLPWLEAVYTAVNFGRVDPHLLPAYLAAGGCTGPTGALGLARVVGGALSWTARNMRVSLGQTSAPPWRVCEATEKISWLWDDVRAKVDRLDSTAEVVFSALR